MRTAEHDQHRALIARFSFPLNVYAWSLLLEQGELHWLHYGIFDHPAEAIGAAQARSTAMLKAHLPDTPQRILEIGIGVGTLLGELAAMGHDVTGITPDSAQIDYARQHLPATVKLENCAFETLTVTEPFDLLLFQESSQYIRVEDILAGVQRHLRPGGTLLILDEFVENPSPDHPSHLHQLDDFLAQAAAVGLRLDVSLALGTQATPTVQTILGLISRWRARLIDDLQLSAAQLDELVDGTQAYANAYAAGHFGYRLLRFQFAPIAKQQIRPLTAVDAPAMQTLFKQSFDDDISPALWHWKYDSASSSAYGLWRDDELIAHYAGFARDVLMFGKPCRALQIGDVMVHPAHRATNLARKGPFFKLASAFLAANIGYQQPFLLGFGFPNRRALGVAAKLGLYADTGAVVALTWTAAKQKLPWWIKLESVDLQALDPRDDYDQLWQSMAAALSHAIVGVRDQDWLQRRYANHPGRDYLAVQLRHRLSRKRLALLIFKREGSHLEWLDFIAKPADWPICTRAASTFAAQRGFSTLSLWISESFASAFSENAAIIDLGINIPCNNWTAGPDAPTLYGKWLLTGGDTDFK